jgi:tetratricopeptide (TPR) repeat protein
VPVQRALAQAYVQSNDLALAEDTLKKAIAGNPGDPQMRVDLAQLLFRNGESQRALQTLQDAVAESPDNLAAQEQLFVYYAARGDAKSARATAETVKSARPDLPLGDYLLGLVYRAEGKSAAAIGSFEAALKLKPNGAEPLTALVEVLVKDNRTDEALARLAAVAREQPQNAIPRNISGEVLLAGRRNAEAQAAFDEAIKLSPSWWVPYRGKAKAQLGAGQADAAENTYKTGLQATGGAVPLGIELAALHESTGRPELAIADYEKLLERSPTNEVLANNLAMLLVTYRDDPQSRERAAQLSARLKDSRVASYVNTAGWVSYQLGRYEEAVPLLRRASEQEPDSPLFRYHLAMAQLKTGQVADAKSNLETALKSNPRFPGSDDARSTLEQLKRS